MPQYHYQATDASGHKVDGEIVAATLEAAREMLVRQGLTIDEISQATPMASEAKQIPARLTAGDSEEILGHFTHAGMSQAPLTDGLRAAAAEATNRRVAAGLRYLAAEIEQGRKPEEVFADPTLRMPAHVRGLVASATQTGRLGPALDELIEHDRSFRYMFWSIISSVAYPLLVLLLAMLVLIYLLAIVVPPFGTLFEDFELRLPTATVSLLHASRTTTRFVFGPAKWVAIVAIAFLFVVLYLTATGRGGARLQRLLEMMPMIGPLWAWAGAAGFLHLLATLLEQGIPLPAALRYAADGMRKADLRQAGFWLAAGVEKGQALSDLVESSSCLPASAVPVLRWGERTGSLAEAARTLSELFAERVSIRTTWLRSASPPIVYLFIVMALGFAVTSLFLPMISLIQGLA